MATTIPLSRELSMNNGAVQKRRYRVVQKEKRRRECFIHEYLRTKYPNIFNEANDVYQTFVEKYPQKNDFTKLYYFKKWQKKIDESRTQLYVPHLPILFPREDLYLRQQEEPGQQQQPPQQEQQVEQPLQQEEPGQQQQPPQQEQQVEQPQQQEEPGQQQQHPQQEEQVEQESHHTEELQMGVQNDLHYTGMSIGEMSLAVDELVKALQSDRELMDIVEGFDLPDGVWDNELAIPDYVLESDLEW